ncbi:H-NS family nucleoid-associated regulatory protein [Azoarcus sp. KH32C]|uniref:H-NS histone family protein n=1 Tax=Azoarcus sp. KH32C TaxID=748247 RepID=UPI0002385BA5|nr:H-NS histone family protein [Azoarcus sp. KH32C]BAL27288.1 DNA-binding protein, histone-like nucleoid-structuring protein H-NS [Azoarcus sp. KH32C]
MLMVELGPKRVAPLRRCAAKDCCRQSTNRAYSRRSSQGGIIQAVPPYDLWLMKIDLGNYTLPQLKQLDARIEKEIARRQSDAKASILKKLTRMAGEYGWSLEEVLGDAAALPPMKADPGRSAEKAPVPVKYRHPSKQDLAWSGRGRKPQWVEAWLAHGGALDALAIAAEKFAKKQQQAARITTAASASPANKNASDAAFVS